MSWKDGRFTLAMIHSKSGLPCKVAYGDKTRELNTTVGKSYPLTLAQPVFQGKVKQIGPIRKTILFLFAATSHGAQGQSDFLARFCNSSPRLPTQSSDHVYSGYNPYQRAYLFEKLDAEKSELAREIAATPEFPLANLCLIIKNWRAASAVDNTRRPTHVGK